MSSVVIAGDTSGSATIQAPAVAGSPILTLPTTSGTLAVSGGSPSFTSITTTSDSSISGLTVGKGGGSVGNNTVVGLNALANGSNTGTPIAAFGVSALAANTTGAQNAAFGPYTLLANTTGTNNTALGSQALVSNTTASNNTAVGYQAGYSNTTGAAIIAVGYQPLYANTTGTQNVAVGNIALTQNTTGGYNTAIGNQSLYGNTTASNNTAVGYQAGYAQTTGNGYNTYLGYQAGNNATGYYNTLVGASTGTSLTTGFGNTFVGVPGTTYNCGGLVTTGTKNTILGNYSGNNSGLDIRTASNYIVLSDGDGNPRQWTDGSGNFSLNAGNVSTSNGNVGYVYNFNGGSANPILTFLSSTTNSNACLEYRRTGRANVTAVNLVFGENSSSQGQIIFQTSAANAGVSGGVTMANGATSWSAYSDSRLKDITGTYTNALDDISQLEAVKFTWKADADKKPCVGVIAQSVQKVIPEAVESAAQYNSEDKTEYLNVRYTDIIPLLVASIQELNAKVTALEAQLGAK